MFACPCLLCSPKPFLLAETIKASSSPRYSPPVPLPSQILRLLSSLLRRAALWIRAWYKEGGWVFVTTTSYREGAPLYPTRLQQKEGKSGKSAHDVKVLPTENGRSEVLQRTTTWSLMDADHAVTVRNDSQI
eukprot:747576-Hanusia_phi.AAC.3